MSRALLQARYSKRSAVIAPFTGFVGNANHHGAVAGQAVKTLTQGGQWGATYPIVDPPGVIMPAYHSYPRLNEATVFEGGYDAAVDVDGPIAHFKFNEAAPGPYTDRLSSLVATASPSATQVASTVQNNGGDPAVHLNGTQTLSVPHTPMLNLGDSFTIEAWVKRSALSAGSFPTIVRKSGGGGWSMFFGSTDRLSFSRISGGGITGGTITSANVQTNDTTNWHHVAVTKDGSDVKLYVDGVEKGDPPVNLEIFDTTGALQFGTGGYNGAIDEVAIYPYPLPAERIAAHYNTGAVPAPDLSMRFELRPGDLSEDGKSRTEVGIGATSQRHLLCFDGDERYFGFAHFYESGFPTNQGWFVSSQWKGRVDGSPTLAIGNGGTANVLQIRRNADIPESANETHWSIPMTTGVWHRWVIRVKFSADPAVGFIEVWYAQGNAALTKQTLSNGLDKKFTYTLVSSTDVLRIRQGYYRNPAHTSTGAFLVDGFKIGSSYAEVEPAVPA